MPTIHIPVELLQNPPDDWETLENIPDLSPRVFVEWRLPGMSPNVWIRVRYTHNLMPISLSSVFIALEKPVPFKAMPNKQHWLMRGKLFKKSIETASGIQINY